MYAHLFNCAADSLPRRLLRTYLESCANIVQAVVYCPPYRPPSCRQSVARRVRSRNPSKSTLAHDAVATAVLHKHHPIIRVGAGLIQFVYRSHLRLATESTRNRNAFSPFFARVRHFSRENAVGALLLQWQPVNYILDHTTVAFMARKLPGTQYSCDARNVEFLAAQMALTTWRTILMGVPFEIYSNHDSLKQPFHTEGVISTHSNDDCCFHYCKKVV